MNTFPELERKHMGALTVLSTFSLARPSFVLPDLSERRLTWHNVSAGSDAVAKDRKRPGL